MIGSDAAENLRMVAGAKTALRDWQEQGGEEPGIELVTVAPGGGWAGPANAIVDALFDPRVLAVIGGRDAASAHIVAQVTTLSRVPFIALSSDSSLTTAFDSWVFRMAPSDGQQAEALLAYFDTNSSIRGVRLLTAKSRRGEQQRAELEEACRRRGLPVVMKQGEGDVVLLFLEAGSESLAFLRNRAAAGDTAPVGASLGLLDPSFLAEAASTADGLFVTALEPAANMQDSTFELARRATSTVLARLDESRPSTAELRERLTQTRGMESAAWSQGFDQRGKPRAGLQVAVLRQGIAYPTAPFSD